MSAFPEALQSWIQFRPKCDVVSLPRTAKVKVCHISPLFFKCSVSDQMKTLTVGVNATVNFVLLLNLYIN